MGLFRKKSAPEETRAINYVPWWPDGPAPASVSAETAMQNVAVFASVRILADNIAALPVKAYRKNRNGLQPITFVPELMFNPSAIDNRFQWIHKCVVSLALRGNAYGAVVARDKNGSPTQVEWIHPDKVEVDETSPALPIYKVDGVEVPRDDIVHIPWIAQPGRVVGMSPIQYFASTIGVGLSAQDYGRQWFDNGGTPPSVMKNTNRSINPDEAKETRRRVSSAIKTGQPLILGSDWDFEAIRVSPNESQFIQTMKLNATQIAAIFGVPAEMIGGEAGSSLTYSTVEQNSINLANLTLRPWLVRLETAFSDLIFGNEEIRFDVDAMIRMDTKARYESYQLALDAGWMNKDEVRAKENLPPLPNGEGQKYGLPVSAPPMPTAPPSPTPENEVTTE